MADSSNKNSTPFTLNLLPVGDSAMVVGFADETLGTKLLSMGIFPGNSISIIRKGPFGDTLYVQAQNSTTIALRKTEAAAILLEGTAPHQSNDRGR